MRIVADENIPFVEEAFGALGEVRLMAGQAIDAAALRGADVLLVRSVTRVDAALLAEADRLRFVGSATIGTDHVDRGLLAARGIGFAHAPGSNAESVVEYVLAALLVLSVRRGEVLRGRTVGIVGCGNIGGRLAARLPAFGVRVLANDPPLAEAAAREGRPHAFVPLDVVLGEADIVTLHVPLTREGAHPTHHLLDADRLAALRPGAWLVNTCRGPVVSNRALLAALRAGGPGAVVLDVWENEPEPLPELVRRVDLATPHIAGYSFDGKVQGTIQLYRALAAALDLDLSWDFEAVLAWTPGDRPFLTPPNDRIDAYLPAFSETTWLEALTRQMYDIGADDKRLRAILDLPDAVHATLFHDLRRHYPRRRAFSRHVLSRYGLPEPFVQPVAEGLRVTVQTD